VGAFSARPAPPQSDPVVLVDDIVTTGSTLSEARHALSEAGWDVIGAATVAETPLRRARQKAQFHPVNPAS
jgi:predicted amidophosphoribosyltransferase